VAITIDYGDPNNLIINVPKTDMTLIQSTPTEIRQLNIDSFRLELKALEDDSTGMAWTRTHRHNTTVTVGGVILARVVEILDPYVVQFEDGMYAVNLTGANSNIADKTVVNQVSVRSANSAGLQDLSTILAAAYDGEVIVSAVSGQTGTVVPLGTRGTPSSNFPDALLIAQRVGASRFRLLESMSITTGNYTGYAFTSDNAAKIILTISPAVVVTDSQFQDLTVVGTLDGFATVRDARLISTTFKSGFIFRSAIVNTLTLTAGEITVLIDCFSDALSTGSDAMIDMSGSAQMEIINFNGELEITNFAGGLSTVEIFINSGNVTLASSVTGGVVHVYGGGQLIDNSAGATVIDGTTGLRVTEMHTRFDLNTASANTYANDASSIVNTDFTLTKTDNGNGTSTVTRT
jgi:hypothetical protein